MSGSTISATITTSITLASSASGTTTYTSPLTITSAGAVSVSSGTAIESSLAGATLINDGLVSGLPYGVALSDGGSVDNDGTITSTGGIGVSIAAGGTVTNEAGARISGGEGIYMQGYADDYVSNSGTIIGTDTDVGASGVYLRNTDSATLINNLGGDIEGGAYLTGVDLSVSNFGDITGVFGVAVSASSVSQVYNDGLISASSYGVFVYGAADVTNAAGGIIDGGVTNYGDVDGLTLDNAGTIISTGGFEDGVMQWGYNVATDANLVVQNSGYIYGSQVGVHDQSAPATITNEAGGTIAGGDYGIDLSHSGLTNTIINAGLISGGDAAIDAAGTLLLEVEAGASFEGAVETDEGTLELVSSTSAGTLDMGSSFSGFTNITFAAGSSWTLEGDAAELADGQTISGFTAGDTLILEGFTATSVSYSSGELLLSDGTTTETINISGSYSSGDFTTEQTAAGTELIAVAPGSTISTTLSGGVTLTTDGSYTSPLTITSTGDIETGGWGVFSELGSSTLVNFGLVNAATYGLAAVEFTDGGLVENYGSLVAPDDDAIFLGEQTSLQSGTIDNYGSTALISGGNGIWIDDGSNDLVYNEGVILGTDSDGYGVEFRDVTDGTIINTASGLINGVAYGAFLDGDSFAVTNAGTLEGRTGIYAYSPDGGVELDNSGLISGTKNGVYLYANATITNSGTISGDDYAITTTGTLLLEVEAGASFVGSVSAAHGELELLSSASAGTLDMGGSFSGFKTIAIDTGASWTLEGTAAELADGQTISGFTSEDTLVLEGFTATSATYSNGELLLSNGTTTEVIHVSGDYTTQDFILEDTANGTEIAVCHLRGTRILTPGGEVAIEDLAIGDEVVTRFGGVQAIKWIGEQRFARRFLKNNREMLPVNIEPGALGEGLPARRLSLSPGHSVLLGDVLVLARDLVNGITITQDDAPEEVHYFNIELAAHDCVVAEGAWSETYADCPGLRAKFHNAVEFWPLYPNAPEAPEAPQLCAPRVTSGPVFEAVLLPVLARAQAQAVPGVLLGYIESLEGELSGWALDVSYPEMVQHLEILLDGKVLGHCLAHEDRADLRDAGYEDGRGGFRWAIPEGIDGAALEVRRVGTGEPLARMPELNALAA